MERNKCKEQLFTDSVQCEAGSAGLGAGLLHLSLSGSMTSPGQHKLFLFWSAGLQSSWPTWSELCLHLLLSPRHDGPAWSLSTELLRSFIMIQQRTRTGTSLDLIRRGDGNKDKYKQSQQMGK